MKPNIIEAKNNMNCGTCDIQAGCHVFATLTEHQHATTICPAYANETKGVYADPKKTRRSR